MIRVSPLLVGFLRTNCYFVWNPETMDGFIVDPGFEGERIVEHAKSLGVHVRGILLTHGHLDHSYAVEDVVNALPDIPVYACKAEESVLADPELNLSGHHMKTPRSVRMDKGFSDNETFSLAGFEIRVLHTPGHTMGSCCFYIAAEGVLLSGDTLFRETYGVTHLATGNHMDMLHSIERLTRELPGETLVFPGHGAETTVEYEKQVNPALSELRRM